jgi:hypothetical protein
MELRKVMEDFYACDLTELKQTINTVVKSETDKITSERDNKVRQIQDNFKRIVSLTKDHLVETSNSLLQGSSDQGRLEGETRE